MVIARFKDFCIDAVDAAGSARFWGPVLGLDVEVHDDGDADLSGPTPAHRVWINQVPEAKSVKHRVHLDVVGDVDELVGIGATVIDRDSFNWIVMTDPEGGEFCVEPGDVTQPYRLEALTFDSRDHVGLASWWADVLGGQLHDHGEYSSVDAIPNTPFEQLTFVDVPETKAIKNRIHIDVTTDSLDELVAAGATVVRPLEDDLRWHVMADPEGNEFCAFVNE